MFSEDVKLARGDVERDWAKLRAVLALRDYAGAVSPDVWRGDMHDLRVGCQLLRGSLCMLQQRIEEQIDAMTQADHEAFRDEILEGLND